MLQAALLERFLSHGVASARRSLLDLVDEAAVRWAVREALESAMRAMDDGPARFGVPKTVGWGDGQALIVMPTAEADSRPLPHAVVLHRTDDPRTDGDLVAMVDAARVALAPLEIDRIALFVHGPESDGGTLAPGVHGTVVVSSYKRWSAASIERVIAAPPDPEATRLSVERPTDLAFYPAYEAMYASFWRDHPALGARIGIESPQAMSEYLSHGGLRLIHVDGRLAGVAAAIRHAEFGLRGWRIRERVLAEGFRGAGLGVCTLRAFVESLDREPGDLVWGTILPENVGSRRSAERLGRCDVGGLIWLARNAVDG